MSDAPRHPDHERVKARLLATFTENYRPDDKPWERIAAEAIAMGARQPDERAMLVARIMPKLADWRSGRKDVEIDQIAFEIVNYVLDNAPKEG